MSVIKGGISVQKSKFAVLAIDSLSDTDTESETDWTQVKTTGTGKPKSKGKQGGAQLANNDGEKPQSKNAKKRARKKKNREVRYLHFYVIIMGTDLYYSSIRPSKYTTPGDISHMHNLSVFHSLP